MSRRYSQATLVERLTRRKCHVGDRAKRNGEVRCGAEAETRSDFFQWQLGLGQVRLRFGDLRRAQVLADGVFGLPAKELGEVTFAEPALPSECRDASTSVPA